VTHFSYSIGLSSKDTAIPITLTIGDNNDVSGDLRVAKSAGSLNVSEAGKFINITMHIYYNLHILEVHS